MSVPDQTDVSSKSLMSGIFATLTTLLTFFLIAAALFHWRSHDLFSKLWFVAFLCSFVIRWPYARRSSNAKVNAQAGGKTDAAVLMLMFLATMVAPLADLGFSMFKVADYHGPAILSWLGIVLLVPYLWLFYRAHKDLSDNWSPALEITAQHKLVVSGVYSFMRHPMYGAFWLAALSQAFLLQNWISGFAAIPAMAALWFIRIPHEEALMQKTFGSDYEEYCKNAGRLWPKRFPLQP